MNYNNFFWSFQVLHNGSNEQYRGVRARGIDYRGGDPGCGQTIRAQAHDVSRRIGN